MSGNKAVVAVDAGARLPVTACRCFRYAYLVQAWLLEVNQVDDALLVIVNLEVQHVLRVPEVHLDLSRMILRGRLRMPICTEKGNGLIDITRIGPTPRRKPTSRLESRWMSRPLTFSRFSRCIGEWTSNAVFDFDEVQHDRSSSSFARR